MTMYEKIAQMKPEQKNHWIDIPELSYWGERFFAQFSVAEALAQPEEFPLLEQIIDHLYASYLSEHALTDFACREAEEKLLPFSQRAKTFRLHCVAHAHIDMDWLWGLHETVDITLNTFRTMLDLMDEYPEFTFSQSQCAVYRMAEFYDPALFRRMKQRVLEGRFEFAGSTWVELDKNMPNLESMARHILYTKQYLNQRFGIRFEDVDMDFQPDTFGHSGAIPEILRAGGIKYFYHCRGLDGEYLYRWRSPSGAEVLALNEPLWYNDWIRPMYLNQVPKFCTHYGIHDMMKVYGVGDHGGGPTRQDIERILDMQNWPVAPTIFFSTYKKYFASIAPYKENFPVLTGELGPTFTGCYTSQSRIKLANRIAEDRLFMSEALTAFAVEKVGIEDFNHQFQAAWERVLFNQFHDILPGSNTPESREHAMGAFEEAMGSVMAASGAALHAFANAIDTSCFETPFEPLSSRSEGGGVGLNVDQKHRFRLPSTERGVGKTRILHFFNPTGFDREEVLEATVWDWPGDPERIQAFDIQGTPLPIVANTISGLEWNHIRTDLLIKCRVPALSYTTVRIAEAEKKSFCFCALPPDPRVTYYHPLVLENKIVRIVFDEADLSVKSYWSKRLGRELLGSDGGRFILYRERTVPKGGCGWVEGVHMQPKDLHRESKTILKAPVKANPLRQTLEYELHYHDSVICVHALLDADSPILELEVSAKWMETADSYGTPKLTFCTALSWIPEQYLSDSQIGVETRRPEPMHDCCSRNFFFAAGGDTGFALLSDCKYGYRGYDDRMEVSLLRSSSRPDPYPELGERSFRIGLAESSADPLSLKALGSRFANRDLPYISNRSHKGTLPLEDSFLHVENAVVNAIKVPEDKNGLILRLTSARMTECDAEVSMPGLKAAVLTDLAEQDLEACTVFRSKVTVPLLPMQTVTLRLMLR